MTRRVAAGVLVLAVIAAHGTAAAPQALDGAEVYDLASAYAWDPAEAVKIAWCESRFDPEVDNGFAVGLYQLAFEYHGGRVGWDRASLYDAEVNTRIAFDVWRDNAGWRGPWAGCIHALN